MQKSAWIAPLAALVSIAPLADAPRWTPKQGTRIERTYTREGKMVLTSASGKVGDESHDHDEVKGTLEIVRKAKLVVTDEFLAVEGGRATEIVRSFDALEEMFTNNMHSLQGDRELKVPRESALTGHSVLFTWDEEHETYASAWRGEGADDELLTGLVADVDLSSWLPRGEVATDDTWEIDATAFRNGILRPCGDLHLESEPKTPAIQKRLEAAMGDAYEGAITATWSGIREKDGRRCGVIALAGRLSTHAEVERQGDEAQPDRLRGRAEIEYEGELLWDLESDRARPRALVEG